MPKLVSFRLRTQDNTTLHVRDYYSIAGWNHRLKEMARTGQVDTGGGALSVAIINLCHYPSESLCSNNNATEKLSGLLGAK